MFLPQIKKYLFLLLFCIPVFLQAQLQQDSSYRLFSSYHEYKTICRLHTWKNFLLVDTITHDTLAMNFDFPNANYSVNAGFVLAHYSYSPSPPYSKQALISLNGKILLSDFQSINFNIVDSTIICIDNERGWRLYDLNAHLLAADSTIANSHIGEEALSSSFTSCGHGLYIEATFPARNDHTRIYGLIDKKGNQVAEPVFKSIYHLTQKSPDVLRVTLYNDVQGTLDTLGYFTADNSTIKEKITVKSLLDSSAYRKITFKIVDENNYRKTIGYTINPYCYDKLVVKKKGQYEISSYYNNGLLVAKYKIKHTNRKLRNGYTLSKSHSVFIYHNGIIWRRASCNYKSKFRPFDF